jgi:hypothetical protein
MYAEKRRRAVELGVSLKKPGSLVLTAFEVPTFGPNKFADLSPFLAADEVEEQLLIPELKQLAEM